MNFWNFKVVHLRTLTSYMYLPVCSGKSITTVTAFEWRRKIEACIHAHLQYAGCNKCRHNTNDTGGKLHNDLSIIKCIRHHIFNSMESLNLVLHDFCTLPSVVVVIYTVFDYAYCFSTMNIPQVLLSSVNSVDGYKCTSCISRVNFV